MYTILYVVKISNGGYGLYFHLPNEGSEDYRPTKLVGLLFQCSTNLALLDLANQRFHISRQLATDLYFL